MIDAKTVAVSNPSAMSQVHSALGPGVDNSYVSRMVNLTTLAPDIVEAILEDALPDHLTLFDLAVDPPALWEEQRLILVPTSSEDTHHYF